MNVLFLSPGFPDEMNWFTEGLAAVGARVFGVGEQPAATRKERCRQSLTAYLQVRSIMDEASVVAEVVAESRRSGVRFDRVECLWEPLQILCARLREAFGAPGLDVAGTIPFRDKEAMKQVLDRAGIRTPRHARCRGAAEIEAAAERIGYPLIIKPIAGAGSADTHRVADAAALPGAIAATRHVGPVSVEEYIDGEEYTFDTICADGKPLYFNMSWYRPRPLIQRQVQWISPQTLALRDVDAPELRGGRQMGLDVLKALGVKSGFTHMEWFLTSQGEAVFGEIGCRPPGARSVDIMNFACDVDLYRGWAEAVCHGTLSQPWQRRHNACIIFKRARGEGRIRAITGMERWMSKHGQHVAHVELLPVGAHRRNWKQTLLSDGHVIVRHPDLGACCAIADSFGTDVQLEAG